MGFLQDAIERHLFAHHACGHQLGELLPHSEGEAQHSSRVFEGLFCLDSAKRDNLSDPIITVLLADVSNNFSPATLVEVHIKVGHGDPVRVQESLKNEPVLERVKLGNPHRIGGHGTSPRPTTGTHSNTVFFRPVDEVSNDKEVAGKPHLRDHADFVLRLRFHPVWDPTGITDSETPMDFLLEIARL